MKNGVHALTTEAGKKQSWKEPENLYLCETERKQSE